MSALVDAIHNGFPDMPSAMFSAIRMYHQYRGKLAEYDGVVLYKDRTYSPIRRLAGTTLGSPSCIDDGVASGGFILLAGNDIGYRRNTCTVYSMQSHGAAPTKCTTYAAN